jgi:hypothetical protein
MGKMFLSSGDNGDVCVFGHLRFWAERGLIHCEDSRDNTYESYSVLSCLRRMRAISDMVGNSTQREKFSEDKFDTFVLHAHQDMLEHMVRIVEKAKVQGMPSDPSARAALTRARPTTLIMPGCNYM